MSDDPTTFPELFFICLSHLEGNSETRDPFNWVRRFPVAKIKKNKIKKKVNYSIFRTSTLKTTEQRVSIGVWLPHHVLMAVAAQSAEKH